MEDAINKLLELRLVSTSNGKYPSADLYQTNKILAQQWRQIFTIND